MSNADICEACGGHIKNGVCTGECNTVYSDYVPPSDEALGTGLSGQAELLLLAVYRNHGSLQVGNENRAPAEELAANHYADLTGDVLLIEEFLPVIETWRITD